MKIAMIASRFNGVVVDSLIEGAQAYLAGRGLLEKDIALVRVPGAFEIPQMANRLAQSKKYSGLVCLGAIVRGETFHFEILAHDVIRQLSHVGLRYTIPIGFGVLTTDTLEQALARCGGQPGSGNKGAEAAAACWELVACMKREPSL